VNYFDTSYLGRLYLQDEGWEKVRELARRSPVCSATLGKAEIISSFHRKYREGAFNQDYLSLLLKQFATDVRRGAYEWLPLSETVIDRVIAAYDSLPASVALRASDAIHLATAAERGLGEIYSNDRRLLSAAQYFGLNGVDIL
jgi:predicted nucleic acid-binding protein